MNKLLISLFAAASLTLAGSVTAAESGQSTSTGSPATSDAPTQQEQVPAQGDAGRSSAVTQATPGTPSTDPAAGHVENLPLAAALKKCDSLSGQKKDDCVSAANKKFGQM